MARFCAILFFCLLVEVAALATPVIIVHETNSLSEIRRLDLKMIYNGDLKIWAHNNSPILPVHLPSNNPLKKTFLDEVLGVSPTLYTRYFQAQVSSGKSIRPPPAAHDEASVLSYVAKHSGAIAYVSDSLDFKGVRIIKVVD